MARNYAIPPHTRAQLGPSSFDEKLRGPWASAPPSFSTKPTFSVDSAEAQFGSGPTSVARAHASYVDAKGRVEQGHSSDFMRYAADTIPEIAPHLGLGIAPENQGSENPKMPRHRLMGGLEAMKQHGSVQISDAFVDQLADLAPADARYIVETKATLSATVYGFLDAQGRAVGEAIERSTSSTPRKDKVNAEWSQIFQRTASTAVVIDLEHLTRMPQMPAMESEAATQVSSESTTSATEARPAAPRRRKRVSVAAWNMSDSILQAIHQGLELGPLYRSDMMFLSGVRPRGDGNYSGTFIVHPSGRPDQITHERHVVLDDQGQLIGSAPPIPATTAAR